MPAAPEKPNEVEKIQFDYAWKWFCFHADQRIRMFNFMLVVFGIFAAGIVNALDKDIPKIGTAGLCFAASALAIIFCLLDRRNKDLVWFGEDVLNELERRAIFGTDVKIKGRYDKEVDFGILKRQALEQTTESWGKFAVRFKLRDWVKSALDASNAICLGKHRIWLPLISLSIAVLFAVAGMWILFRDDVRVEEAAAIAITKSKISIEVPIKILNKH
jgi:hypothetical protein